MTKEEKLICLYSKIKNAKKNIFDFRKVINTSELNLALKSNEVFKNINAGKRCFVLGNGPSLKQEDLSLLENEFVFTVNQASKLSQFKTLKTNYHFWADPEFFNIRDDCPEDMQLIDAMKAVNTENNIPECFFPIEHKHVIEKYKLDEVLHVHYFAIGLTFYEGYKKDIDFTRFVPGFDTVVMSCIIMAIYMGFSEIFVLGIDSTGIVTVINSFMDAIDEKSYAYKVSDIEKSRMKNMLSRHTLEQHVSSFLRLLEQYRRLNLYCEERGIKFVNCSATTVIDSVPRESLSDVVREIHD